MIGVDALFVDMACGFRSTIAKDLRTAGAIVPIILWAREAAAGLSLPENDPTIGVLDKHRSPELLVPCIEAVRMGRPWTGSESAGPNLISEPPPSPVHLAAREGELMRLVSEGLSNRQIAERLHLTEGTVVYQVLTLRVPQDLLRRQPPPPPKPAPAPVERTRQPVPVAKAAPKAFVAPPVPAPAKSEVVILQPPTVRADPQRLKDLNLPTLTMVTPAAVPKAYRNFDVGALEKRRTAARVPDPGPLPEPPPDLPSVTAIRPTEGTVTAPKLAISAAPPPANVIDAAPKGPNNTGGPKVPNPGNLITAGAKPVPAGQTVTVPDVIAAPPSSGPAVRPGVVTQTPPVDTAGGTGKAPSSQSGASNTAVALSASPTPIKIVHPSSGKHDVTIIHSGGEQMLPEARGLLEGDPVYTVYLNVGWTREWILHFCVPREGPPQPKPVGGVVTLGGAAAEVKPPYPLVTLAPPQSILPPPPPIPLSQAERRRLHMLFHGFLGPNGKFQTLRQRATTESEAGAQVLEHLESWEMRPATRDGLPVRVQVIVVVLTV
jgi:hypothetical protein